MLRNRTPVVNGLTSVNNRRFATVKGLNAFWIGTLIPREQCHAGTRIPERIRRKRTAPEKNQRTTGQLKVGKKGQVFVANIAGERAIEAFDGPPEERWRQSREIIGNIIPIGISGKQRAPPVDVIWEMFQRLELNAASESSR